MLIKLRKVKEVNEKELRDHVLRYGVEDGECQLVSLAFGDYELPNRVDLVGTCCERGALLDRSADEDRSHIRPVMLHQSYIAVLDGNDLGTIDMGVCHGVIGGGFYEVVASTS